MGTTKVVTGKVRASFVHIFTPHKAEGASEAKYDITILIPKSDKETMKKLRAAQQEALEAGKEKKFGGTIPKKWDDTIHDGDEDADLEKYPEMAGHYYVRISAKENTPPGVVDRYKNEIMDESEVYSGCYVRVSCNAFPFNFNGKKGVSFGLNNVQKLADGQPLGGSRSKPEDDFDDFEDEDDDLGIDD